MADLLVLSEVTERVLMEQIVRAAQALVYTSGQPVALNTMDEITLRTAARTAVNIATGQIVWPASLGKLVVRRPQPVGDIFETI
jgi:hypothetical protein